MRYVLIANPVSGFGLARSQISLVEAYFRKHGQVLEVRLTRAAGDAERLARDAASDAFDVIIAGGGDGTINEVLNGMAGSGKKLAVIPWGTGNVFAKEMRFPKGLGAVCRLILQGRSERMDVGLYGQRRFLLMVGAGFDAYSLKQLAGQGLKRRLGVIAYAAAGIKAFARYRFPAISLELEDGRKDSGSFVLVSNTSRYGDVLSFTPNATPFDGLLDVFVFRETGRFDTIILGLRYLLRFIIDPNLATPPLGLQRSRIYRTRRLRLSSAKPVLTQVDGEVGVDLPVELAVERAAVDLIVPRPSVRRYRRRQRKQLRREAGRPKAGQAGRDQGADLPAPPG
jgi:YegS/Rv2252/BmrU family lipid kinase